MPSFEESRVLPCSARHVYDVVMDIEAYPEFLPWLHKARIVERKDDELTAELVAEFAGIHHAFQTVDRYLSPKLVEVRLLKGPFRYLDSLWTFEEIGVHSCRVHFSIEFEFKSVMLSLVASPIFSGACRSMVHVFEERAMKLYDQVSQSQNS